MPALVQSVTLEVGPGQVEQHLRVVEVVELTKAILILWNGEQEWGMDKSTISLICKSNLIGSKSLSLSLSPSLSLSLSPFVLR